MCGDVEGGCFGLVFSNACCFGLFLRVGFEGGEWALVLGFDDCFSVVLFLTYCL